MEYLKTWYAEARGRTAVLRLTFFVATQRDVQPLEHRRKLRLRKRLLIDEREEQKNAVEQRSGCPRASSKLLQSRTCRGAV